MDLERARLHLEIGDPLGEEALDVVTRGEHVAGRGEPVRSPIDGAPARQAIADAGMLARVVLRGLRRRALAVDEPALDRGERRADRQGLDQRRLIADQIDRLLWILPAVAILIALLAFV